MTCQSNMPRNKKKIKHKKEVFSQSKFLLNVAKKSYFVIKVNEYSFLEQTWCLDCVKHMSVSESVSHKDKISSKNNIYRKKQ